jgi:hypothetical protein
MADSTQAGQDCFPSREKGELLPSPIPRSEIASELERIYESLGRRIKQLFDKGVKFQQNQGRLSTVFDAIRKKADFAKGARIDGDMNTFGDLRLMRRRISEGITEGLTSKAGLALDDRIRNDIKASFESECARYSNLIGQQLLFPDEPLTIQEIPESQPNTVRSIPEASAPTKQPVPKTRVSVELPAPEPLLPLSTDEVLKASPALIIRYMDGINEQSNGGLEDDVKPIIAKLGIPWANFRLWRDEYVLISDAADILATGPQPKVGQLKKGVVQWVLRTVKMECDNDEQQIAERMNTLGLGFHYAYRQNRRGEEVTKVRTFKQKAEPVIDPRWNFLKDAPPRAEPSPKPIKEKKVKRERDPRLLEADYQLLLLTRRLLKAVETDQLDPWVYAIGKFTRSLEEKPETKLA